MQPLRLPQALMQSFSVPLNGWFGKSNPTVFPTFPYASGCKPSVHAGAVLILGGSVTVVAAMVVVVLMVVVVVMVVGKLISGRQFAR